MFDFPISDMINMLVDLEKTAMVPFAPAHLFLSELLTDKIAGFAPTSSKDLGSDNIGTGLRAAENKARPTMAALSAKSRKEGKSVESAVTAHVATPKGKELSKLLQQFVQLAKARVGADWLMAHGFADKVNLQEAIKAYESLLKDKKLGTGTIASSFKEISLAKNKGRGILKKVKPIKLGNAGKQGLALAKNGS